MEYCFTKAQERKISKELKKVVTDMLKILKESGLEEITVFYPTTNRIDPSLFDKDFLNGDLMLIIKSDYIMIRGIDNGLGVNSHWWKIYMNPILTVMDKDKKRKVPVACQFLMNYAQNRPRIIEAATLGKEEKETISSKVDKQLEEGISHIEQVLKDEVLVEFNLPETTDQKQIELHNENGVNIGIIDFGGKTVKIITTGDIVLVNREKAQSRIKSKNK